MRILRRRPAPVSPSVALQSHVSFAMWALSTGDADEVSRRLEMIRDIAVGLDDRSARDDFASLANVAYGTRF